MVFCIISNKLFVCLNNVPIFTFINDKTMKETQMSKNDCFRAEQLNERETNIFCQQSDILCGIFDAEEDDYMPNYNGRYGYSVHELNDLAQLLNDIREQYEESNQ